MKPQVFEETDIVANVIADVAFLVRRCDEHITQELRQFLINAGCPATIIGQVGY